MRLRLVTAAAVLLLSAPGKASAHRPHSTCANHPQRAVRACIWHAANRWHVSYSLLRARAWCESRFIPTARGGLNLGLFQFQAGTWSTTPYAGHDVFSAHWASLGAAWMQHVGRGGEWGCTGRTA